MYFAKFLPRMDFKFYLHYLIYFLKISTKFDSIFICFKYIYIYSVTEICILYMYKNFFSYKAECIFYNIKYIHFKYKLDF